MVRRSRVLAFSCIAAATAVASCESGNNNVVTTVTPPVTPTPGAARPIVAVAEVTFQNLGTSAMTAGAVIAKTAAGLEVVRSSGTTSTLPSPGIEVKLLAAGSFTFSPLNAAATRYVRATLSLRNTRTDSVAFDRSNPNLALVAIATTNTLATTEVRSLTRSDGSLDTPEIALQIRPTQLIADDGAGGIIAVPPDILTALSASQVAAIQAPTGVTKVEPYAFFVLGAPPGFTTFDASVTVAYAIPIQARAADNPSSISILFMIVDRTM